MSVIKTSVKRPLTIIMVFLIVMMFGLIGYNKMALNLMPDIEIPVVLVTTTWAGAGPEDVDEQVSQKIEAKIAAISNVEATMTQSNESVSMVMAQFDFGTKLDDIMNDVRSSVDAVQGSLPDDATKSTVLKIDMNAQAIAQLVISGESDPDVMMEYAEEKIQPKIESVGGITSADIKGGDKSQVNVIANPEKLSTYGVSLSTIQGILSSSNKTFPYGSITQGEDKIVLRGIDKLESLDDIKQIQVPVKGGETIRLDSICDVELGKVDKEAIYRYDGKESLVIDILKQQDANTVRVMEDVYKAVEELEKESPEYKIEITNDTSEYVSESISSVMSNLIISAIISFVVIFAFLKSVRASLVVAVAIPVSIIGTIAVLYFTGESLNLITASSLVIAVGMVVDNATVVIESIFQVKKEKPHLSIDECSIEGTQSVTNAITASTLTTVAIFLPIMLTDGIAKIIFGALGLTLISALMLSLVGAITIVPSIFAKLSRGKNSVKLEEKESPWFEKIKAFYQRMLAKCLTHKKKVVIVSIGIFISSVVGATFIGMDFMPAADMGELSVSIKVPDGLNLEASDYYVSMAEEKLSDIKEIKTVMTSLSTGAMSGGANITIGLVDDKERKRSTDEVEQDIVNAMATIPDCEINVSQNSSIMSSGMSSADLTMELKGPDIDVLEALGKEIEGKLGAVSGFRNVKTSLQDSTEEAQFIVDKEKAQQYGVNPATISTILRTAINGDSVTTATIDDYKVDVNLKFNKDDIDNLEDIKQLKVTSATGNEVPLGAFAQIKMEKGMQAVTRTDGDYSVSVTATTDNLDTGTASKLALEAVGKIDMPRDYSVGFGGETEMMNESMASLVGSMLIAVVLVYMVMVAQFESFGKPFIIMFSIPFAFVGVVFSLLITGKSLSTVGMLGIILLIGIVINNGIVLIDYIEQLRKTSDENLIDLVAKGCATRLRPVLMTTLTTILGMLPTALSLGEGGETMQPLAIVVMGGLTVSTLITLILIPAIYLIFDKLETKIGKKINKISGKLGDKTDDLVEKLKDKVKRKEEAK